MSDRPRFINELRGQLLRAAPVVERRRSRLRRIAVTATAVGLAVGAMALRPVVVDDDPSEVVVVAGDADVTSTTTAVEAPIGEIWTSLDTSIGGEANPGIFWSGSEVLVMRTENGGNDVIGERWNPVTNETTRIAASGLSWRVGSAMVWTGQEVLVVGGSSGPALNRIGAAYDPATDAWRSIADPPGDVDEGESRLLGPGVWTGSEMIVWFAGLAYDPAADSWRTIETVPLSQRSRPITVWTGTELIVWGGCWVSGAQCDETNSGLLADGAIYNPAADLWTEMPPSPLPGAVHLVAGWSGSEMITVLTEPDNSAETPAAAFDPATMTWRTLEPSPLAPRRGAAGVWADDRFVIWGGGDGRSDSGVNDGAAYDPITDQWDQLPQGPGPGRSLHSMIATDAGVYISATRTQSPPLLLHIPARSDPPRDVGSGVVAPPGCVSAPTRPVGSGLVGLPIDSVWPDGFEDGFDLADNGYATIEDPALEGSWYVIGAAVRDRGGRPLGLGIWLMPDPIVSFSRVGPPTNPADDPGSWHLYAYNELAKQSSVWRSSEVVLIEAEPSETVRPCVADLSDPLPFISGTLLNGRTWVLTDDSAHGLCLAESGVDYGCDDRGPVIRPDDPPETMRIASTRLLAPEISEDNAGDLAYGYLPAGAVEIELVLADGSVYVTEPVLDGTLGMWATPIEPGNNPRLVRYLDAAGQEVASSSR